MRSLILLLSFTFSVSAFAQTVQEQVSTKYSPWSLSGFSLISSESDQASNGGQLNSYNFVGPNYRLNFKERVAFKAAFNANTSGYSRFSGECYVEQDASFADSFFEYRNTNLGWLPGIADIFWSGRVYVPTSKNSQRQGMISRYASQVIFNRRMTKNWMVEYRNDFDFYHQSQATYRSNGLNSDCTVGDRSGLSNTRQFRLENWLSTWYIVNRNFSLGFSGIIRDDFFNSSNGVETSRQRNGRMHEITMYLGPQLRYNYSFNASFILSFRDKIEYSGFHPNRQDD